MKTIRRKSIVALLAGAALMALTPASVSAASSETYEQLELFGDIFERVRAEYVEQVDDAELIEAAINGMLSSLDPHSSYLNAKNFQEMQVQTRGSFGGLGIEVTMEKGLVKVITPIDDTPAYRAGVMPGDLITHLDQEPVFGLTLTEAVERMRGPVDSTLEVTIRRPSVDEPFDVVITRAVIKLQSVRWRAEGDTGYVRITNFSEATARDVKKAVAELKEELGDTLEGYVLDLRNNPGGLLDQAVQVSDLFLERGEIVSTRGRSQGNISRYNAKRGDISGGKPIIVLVNGGSASAAEIVAGALQDHNRAIVMGTTSFGKGSVQTVTPLQGHGALRMTTSRYYTPSGQSIQARGIDPDISVAQAHIEEIDLGPRRTEASLPNRLDSEEAPDAEDGATRNEDEGEASSDDAAPEDYQLTRALDLLHGLSLFGSRATN